MSRLKDQTFKGRGSGSNQQSRYLPTHSELVDDGWGSADALDESAPKTFAYPDRTKTLITQNQSPDISFSQSVNAYKGCEHGCIYCFARPTHAFLDLSPGLDFETKIFFKTRVKEHLLKELAKPSYRCSVLAMGTNTDPYQPLEKTKRITREILETLWSLKHPVSIVTKGSLILRDVELLADMAKLGLVNVSVSVTTLSHSLKTKLEPRTAGPAARLKVIGTLAEAGVPTGAMIAPVIPFINDQEIEDLVKAVAGAGAQAINYILIRLPLEVRPLFEEWLANHYPLQADRVMAAIRDTRGGRAYRAQWHQRMTGQGVMAELIFNRFRRAVAAVGLADVALPKVRTDLFVKPQDPADQQLTLF